MDSQRIELARHLLVLGVEQLKDHGHALSPDNVPRIVEDVMGTVEGLTIDELRAALLELKALVDVLSDDHTLSLPLKRKPKP